MALFKRRTAGAGAGRRSVDCPLCSSNRVSLGAVDRVTRTVRHSCNACGYRWNEGEIDLVRAELASSTRREAERAVRR